MINHETVLPLYSFHLVFFLNRVGLINNYAPGQCKYWDNKLSQGCNTCMCHFIYFALLLSLKLAYTYALPCCKQLVQVIINTTHLEQSCHFLEEFISNITNVPPDTVNTTKLYGTSTFKVPALFFLLSQGLHCPSSLSSPPPLTWHSFLSSLPHPPLYK